MIYRVNNIKKYLSKIKDNICIYRKKVGSIKYAEIRSKNFKFQIQTPQNKFCNLSDLFYLLTEQMYKVNS